MALPASRFFSRLIIIILFKSRYSDCGELDFQSSYLQCVAGRGKNYILIVVHGRKSIMNRFCKGLKKQLFKMSEMLLFIAVFFSRPVSIFLKPLDKLHIIYRDRPTVGSYYINIYIYLCRICD